MLNLEFPASLKGSKAEGAISRNSKFILRNSKFHVIPQLDWGISIENFRISLFFCGLGGVFFLEILEFPKIRHCERSEAISFIKH